MVCLRLHSSQASEQKSECRDAPLCTHLRAKAGVGLSLPRDSSVPRTPSQPCAKVLPGVPSAASRSVQPAPCDGSDGAGAQVHRRPRLAFLEAAQDQSSVLRSSAGGGHQRESKEETGSQAFPKRRK